MKTTLYNLIDYEKVPTKLCPELLREVDVEHKWTAECLYMRRCSSIYQEQYLTQCVMWQFLKMKSISGDLNIYHGKM